MSNLPVSQYCLLEGRINRWTRWSMILLGILTFGLVVGALYNRSASGQVESELASLTPELEKARKTFANAGRGHDFPSQSSYDALKAFQKQLTQVALYRGCFITTFQIAGEPMAYVDPGDKSKSSSTLMQGSVRFELTGKTLDVISAIQQIAVSEVPIEFDSLELRRGKATANGADLIATCSLRIIGELPGGKTS